MKVKKIVTLLTTVAVCFLVGCGNQNTDKTASVTATSNKEHTSVITQNISGTVAGLTQDDLIERSCLVAIGTVANSESFQIQPANGADPSVFTDYTVKVSDITRGEVEADSIIVRVQGGKTETLATVADEEAKLENNKTYLLFLYKPERGGDYNTEGDYYYVTGAFQGAYEIGTDVSVSMNTSFLADTEANNDIQCVNSKDTEAEWLLSDAVENVQEINDKHPADVNYMRDQAHENMRANVESGMMTEEEYNQAIAAEQEYATIIK